MSRQTLFFTVFVLSPLLFSACGGGNDGRGASSPPTFSPSVLSKSANKTVVKALNLGTQGVSIRQALPAVLPASGGSESVVIESRFKGNSPDRSDIAEILEAVRQFKAAAGSNAVTIFQAVTPIPFQQSCGSGFTDDNNTPNDGSDDSFQISLNCSGFGAGGGSSASGSFSAGPKYNADGILTHYEFAYTNYTLSNSFAMMDNQNGRRIGTSTETSSRNGTVLLDVAPGNCFRGSVFENVAGTFNLSGIDRRDADGDGFDEVNETFALTDLVITITETEEDCANGPVTVTINGTDAFTDYNDASRSITSVFTDVQLVMTPSTRNMNGIPTKGFEHSLSGTMTVTSPNFCVDATHTISTETPFFVANGASCAVQGKQLLTNTSSAEVTAVTATPEGGLDIDIGNDGSIEQNFTDCKEAIVCTTP